MHLFIESAQRTLTQQVVSATPSLNTVLIIYAIIDSTVLCIVLHTVHRIFQKCNFWWTHLACLGPSIENISHTISVHKITLKSKTLATKCIFQIYSQLLDICTRLVFKTAEEFILPSVHRYLILQHYLHCSYILFQYKILITYSTWINNLIQYNIFSKRNKDSNIK